MIFFKNSCTYFNSLKIMVLSFSVYVCCIRNYVNALTILVQVFSFLALPFSIGTCSDYSVLLCSFICWSLLHGPLFFFMMAH